MEHCTLVLTTQCNLACRYCALCRENGPVATPDQVLNACREAAAAGVRRFNLAGGDPLLLDDLPGLIRRIKALPGVEWVSLTTNGTRLYPQLVDLKQAGLGGINLHLDACDAFTFTGITGKSQLLNEILKGAWAAVAQDISLTISAVLLEDNASNLGGLAGLAKPYDLTVRFVPAPANSGEQGPDEAAALEILRRSVKSLTPDGSGWRAPGFKGRIEFGRSLWGAFGMEQGGVRYCVET